MNNSIKFTSQKGTELTATIHTNPVGEKSLLINNSKFFIQNCSIKSHDVEGYLSAKGVSSKGVEEIIISIDAETKKALKEFLMPENVKISLVRKFDDFIVHNSGEDFVTKEVWLMADGSEREFTVFKKEF